MGLSRVIWRKSTLSNANGGQCVEVGVYTKSSLSGGNGGSCVEVSLAVGSQAGAEHKADADHLFLVRDSKDPNGPVLAFTPSAWDDFVRDIKHGALAIL